MSKLSTELAALLNTHSRENVSDTPDFILAEYMMACLEAFELAVCRRESWYGRPAPDADPRPEAPAVKAPEEVPGRHEAGVARLRAKRKARPLLKLRGIPCPDCEGKGGADVEDSGPGWFSWHDCKRCGGTGEIL